MGKDSSQFLTSLYLGSLSILSFSSCNAESITVFGTPINSPIKYNGVLFDLDSCAIFISKKSYVKQTGHGYSIARRPVLIKSDSSVVIATSVVTSASVITATSSEYLSPSISLVRRTRGVGRDGRRA